MNGVCVWGEDGEAGRKNLIFHTEEYIYIYLKLKICLKLKIWGASVA